MSQGSVNHFGPNKDNSCLYFSFEQIIGNTFVREVWPWKNTRPLFLWIRSDQLLSRVRLFATPWIAARQASLSISNSRSSLRLTSIESVMPSSHLILCRPLLLLPPPSQHQSLFQWVNSSHEVAKVLEFQLQHHSFQRNPRADLL